MFRQRDVRERETFARCRSIESIGTYSSRSEPADDGSFAPRNVAGMRVQYIVFRSVGANIELFRQLFENKQKNSSFALANRDSRSYQCAHGTRGLTRAHSINVESSE